MDRTMKTYIVLISCKPDVQRTSAVDNYAKIALERLAGSNFRVVWAGIGGAGYIVKSDKSSIEIFNELMGPTKWGIGNVLLNDDRLLVFELGEKGRMSENYGGVRGWLQHH